MNARKKVTLTALLLAGILLIGSGVTSAFAYAPSKEKGAMDFKSRGVYLADYNTGTVMFEQNATDRKPIASMVKIMTLLLSFEYVESGALGYDDNITVSEEAAGMGGSQAFLDAHQNYKVDDLLKSIVIASANDSCVAMAETVAGSVEGFVAKMNEKASALGMTETKFANCTGLPAPEQYSCARDVSYMLRELIKFPRYFTYSNVWMYDLKHATGRVTGLTNTNKLVRFYDGCDGGKTGFTDEALHCLAATAKRNTMRVIAVVVGAPDSKTRFAEVSKLFNHAFANFESKNVVMSDMALEEKAVVKGGYQKSDITVKPVESFSVFCEKGKAGKLEIKTELSEMQAPVKIGDIAGKLSVISDGQVIKEINLVAAEDVREKTYGDYWKEFIGKLRK